MNPPPQSTDLNSSTTSSSTVLLNSTLTSGRRIPGFASLINLQDECAITRGRHIQISQLGVINKLSAEEMGPGVKKKRWSFHSSDHISDILKEDKVIKPISSPKRRKSSGSALTKSIAETCAFTEEVSQRGQSKASLREQPQSSRHALSSRQLETHRHHHRHQRRSKLITLRESEASSSKSRELGADKYYMQVDSFPSSYHHFRMRQPKQIRESTAPDYLTSLPDEVLLRIFKYLPKPSLANLARTSHRYLRLIEDDTLWKRLCVMGRMMEPEHLLVILSRKPMYLRMARSSIPDPVDVPSDLSTLRSSSQLSHLDLSSAEISPSALALIMKISPKLVKLSLEHLVVTKQVLEAMMSSGATIEVLNLTMCYDVDSVSLITFLSSCQRLRELNMGCLRVDWGIEALTNVCNALPVTVQQLNLSGFRNLLDNTHVKIIATRCPRLIELDISDSSQEVQTKSIDYILSLTHLQHLGLSRCYGIEPNVYHKLVDHKSLKYIDLFALFKENTIRQLSSCLPRIEINKFPFSAIARPTVGNKRSSIWLQRVRD